MSKYDPPIRLIGPNTDISSLKMSKLNWDVWIMNKVPYQVVRIEDYYHSIGGEHGNNNLWMYPRGSEPTCENLIEYNCRGCGVNWGISYDPYNYIKTKWDETESFTCANVCVTRNGKPFYHCHSLDEARYLIGSDKIQDHPLNFNEIDFDKRAIERKVWWRSQPAIITMWIGGGQACVILEPDGIDKFQVPPEFVDEDDLNDPEVTKEVKTNVFDKHIWWFRD